MFRRSHLKCLFILVLSLCIILSSAAFAQAESPADAEYAVGSIITFGHYPHTADGTDATPIQWRVLARDGSKALLVSLYALDAKPYHTINTIITWEECTLRAWLNDEFLNMAFTAEEQAGIPTTLVTADPNPTYRTTPGNDVQDKVFLLSVTEAETYYQSDEDRQCKPTAYAVQQGAFVSPNDGTQGNCWRWLRTPGHSQVRATGIGDNGVITRFGELVDYAMVTIRPALWINLDSGVF